MSTLPSSSPIHKSIMGLKQLILNHYHSDNGWELVVWDLFLCIELFLNKLQTKLCWLTVHVIIVIHVFFLPHSFSLPPISQHSSSAYWMVRNRYRERIGKRMRQEKRYLHELLSWTTSGPLNWNICSGKKVACHIWPFWENDHAGK